MAVEKLREQSSPGETGTGRPAGKPQRKVAENATAYLMMVPALVPYLVYTLIPVLWLVYISFTSYDGFSAPTWVGLENYTYALQDVEWWRAVLNTFIFGGGKLLIEVPLALALAVILNEKIFGSALFRTVFFLPHVTSIAIMGIVFFFIFRPVDGILNGLLQGLGVIDDPIDYLGRPVTAMLSVIFVSVWHGLGILMIFFLAGLQTISREVYESASVDGANSFQKFWYITLPLLGPITKIAVIWTVIQTLRSFDLIKTLTDGGPVGSTDVMFTYIFDYFFGSTYGTQFGYGSALGVIGAVIVSIAAVLYLRWTRQRESVHGA